MQPAQFAANDQPLSVSDYLQMMNELIGTLNVSVKGELTSIDVRGHNIFATIADHAKPGKLSLYIYKPMLDRLGIKLQEGMEVIVSGIASIYPDNGKFSMNVKKLVPVGEGALKAAYDRLVARLKEEGLFSTTTKRPIPEYPVHIGVISSERGDALFDFRKHLLPFNLKLHFIDARVEGVNAIDSVVDALRRFNESNLPLDVIVVTRGGGSLESLQAFNSEQVARAIKASRVPVISAIGHEQDVTIADYVADLRASTPTDAAKKLSYHWSKAAELLKQYDQSLTSNFRKSTVLLSNRLEGTVRLLLERFAKHTTTTRKSLEITAQQAVRYIDRIEAKVTQQERIFSATSNAFFRTVQQYGPRLQFMEQDLFMRYGMLVQRTKSALERIEIGIESNDPKHKMKQGYSIVTDGSGQVVRDASSLSPDAKLNLQFYSGSAEARIENINTDSKEL